MPMGEVPRRTIHALRSARHYFVDEIFWGDDEEGVILYLRAQGVSTDDIAKEGVAQSKASTRLSAFIDVKPGVPYLDSPGKYYG
jgi:hypothetical protein